MIETKTHLYLFEFKLLGNSSLVATPQAEFPKGKNNWNSALDPTLESSPTSAKRALEIAHEVLAQIDNKDYTLPFKDSGKTIIKIGAVFSVQERNILEWVTK